MLYNDDEMKKEQENKVFKQNVNFDLLMQKQIDNIVQKGFKPTLLLHSCCAPCSSFVLERLQNYFEISIYFYNSNMYPAKEFEKREAEIKRLIKLLNDDCNQKQKENSFEDSVFHPTPIKMINAPFNPEDFYEAIKGHENQPERGSRCYLCYALRIEKTGKVAKAEKFDFFTTTLTVSPYKNANWINKVGKEVSEKEGVEFLYSDFKKNNGYKKSIELSKRYKLYRQDFCGCEFSYKAKKNKD